MLDPWLMLVYSIWHNNSSYQNLRDRLHRGLGVWQLLLLLWVFRMQLYSMIQPWLWWSCIWRTHRWPLSVCIFTCYKCYHEHDKDDIQSDDKNSSECHLRIKKILISTKMRVLIQYLKIWENSKWSVVKFS